MHESVEIMHLPVHILHMKPVHPKKKFDIYEVSGEVARQGSEKSEESLMVGMSEDHGVREGIAIEEDWISFVVDLPADV